MRHPHEASQIFCSQMFATDEQNAYIDSEAPSIQESQITGFLQLFLSFNEVSVMVRDYLKEVSTPSYKAAEGHKETVSVQTGEKSYMDAACGKTFEDYFPSLLLSVANFNEECWCFLTACLPHKIQ